MKAARLFALLGTAAAACRSTAPPARNTLPSHRPLTEMTTAEPGEPSRRAGLALPDSSRRELPKQP